MHHQSNRRIKKVVVGVLFLLFTGLMAVLYWTERWGEPSAYVDPNGIKTINVHPGMHHWGRISAMATAQTGN